MILLSAAHIFQAQSATSLAATLDEEAMWELLLSQDVCMSEEQLLHIVTEWCKAHAPDQFLQMMMHIDFGRLKYEQVISCTICIRIFSDKLSCQSKFTLHTCA